MITAEWNKASMLLTYNPGARDPSMLTTNKGMALLHPTHALRPFCTSASLFQALKLWSAPSSILSSSPPSRTLSLICT
jgi:hypothetical protein